MVRERAGGKHAVMNLTIIISRKYTFYSIARIVYDTGWATGFAPGPNHDKSVIKAPGVFTETIGNYFSVKISHGPILVAERSVFIPFQNNNNSKHFYFRLIIDLASHKTGRPSSIRIILDNIIMIRLSCCFPEFLTV